MPELKVKLEVGDRGINATVNLPGEPIRPIELLPILQNFSEAFVSLSVSDADAVSCRAGCGACCRQLVPISESEALFLAELIDRMPPDRKDAVLARFQYVIGQLEEHGMMERLAPQANTDQLTHQQVGFDYFQLGLPCPFLEDESCSIHPDRPLSCREYLVTSPAENCADLLGKPVALIPMFTKLSLVLQRFSDGKGEMPINVIPLPLLLRYAAQNRAEDQPRLDAKAMLVKFLNLAMEPKS